MTPTEPIEIPISEAFPPNYDIKITTPGDYFMRAWGCYEDIGGDICNEPTTIYISVNELGENSEMYRPLFSDSVGAALIGVIVFSALVILSLQLFIKRTMK